MRFVVHHHSRYRYDVPVALTRHVVRLTPRAEAGRLDTYRLRVTPQPLSQRTLVDAHGNSAIDLDFAGACQELCIDSEFELETSPPPSPSALALPPLPWWVDHGGGWARLGYHGSGPVDESVRHFAQSMAHGVSLSPLPFLDELARFMYESFHPNTRHGGYANPAASTLASRSGACRDLTVLFIEAARSQGIAARFVSGYQAHAETSDTQCDLHAWPEVFMPGVGFCGWDPTQGGRTVDGHVALCAAADPSDTLPIAGGFTFDGTVVNSTLDFNLRIATHA